MLYIWERQMIFPLVYFRTYILYCTLIQCIMYFILMTYLSAVPPCSIGLYSYSVLYCRVFNLVLVHIAIDGSISSVCERIISDRFFVTQTDKRQNSVCRVSKQWTYQENRPCFRFPSDFLKSCLHVHVCIPLFLLAANGNDKLQFVCYKRKQKTEVRFPWSVNVTVIDDCYFSKRSHLCISQKCASHTNMQ
jgi:hypothetical protein